MTLSVFCWPAQRFALDGGEGGQRAALLTSRVRCALDWLSQTETTTMLRSGKEHLESLRDGRVVYIGNEKVDDVTTHPAFRNAAQTVVALYDMKADPALRAEMTYEEDGGRHSIYFLRA